MAPGSDPLLQAPPNPILASFCTFRGIPVDLDAYNP